VHELRNERENKRERERDVICREGKKEEEVSVEALAAFELCSVATTTGTVQQDRHQLNIPIHRQGLVRRRGTNSLSLSLSHTHTHSFSLYHSISLFLISIFLFLSISFLLFFLQKKSFLTEKTTRRGQKKFGPIQWFDERQGRRQNKQQE
jgi:hypothetical protein